MDRPNKHQPAGPQVETPGQSVEPQGLPGKSVGADRAWAQNRIANFFKGQQAGRIQRKPQDPGGAKPPAASHDAHPESTKTLEQACAADPGIAKQKWHDVMSEKQPRALAQRESFIAGATKRLHDGLKPLEAMRQEVTASGQKYLCLGNLVPEQIITGSNGVSRVLDLPSLFNNTYLNGQFLRAHDINNADQFISVVREGKFDPKRDLLESAPLRGKAEETWWFPSSAASAANLEKLRHELYIHQDPAYDRGAVRLDMDPGALKAARVELFKPTSFDGMMQGWEGDAWWKHSEDPHWGLTKNNTYEAVMKMMSLEHFKKRTLIMPTSAAPKSKDDAANAPSGGGDVHAQKPGKHV